MTKEFTLKEINTIAKKILKKVGEISSDTATVIALHGELGSGKTTLTQSIAKILGVKKNIISPTFVIMKGYILNSKNNKWKNLVHIDAYRLKKSSELLHLGWQELFKNKENLIIIEWPEQVPDCIPKNACKIKLTHKNEDTRTIKF